MLWAGYRLAREAFCAALWLTLATRRHASQNSMARLHVDFPTVRFGAYHRQLLSRADVRCADLNDRFWSRPASASNEWTWDISAVTER